MSNILKTAQQVLRTEAAALDYLSHQLDHTFEQVVTSLLGCRGKVVLCGMGKSGLVARKIAATLSSTGTPSFFLHPSEAIHGDWGCISAEDCLISVSHSGETDELLRLLPSIQALGIVHITIVGNPNSTLAQNAHWYLSTDVQEEGASLTIVPMASTLASMALGDALAAALLSSKNFSADDFAKLHQGGNIGHKLVTPVRAVMQREPLPTAHIDAPIQEIVVTMSSSNFGLVVLVDDHQKITGIITDGDLRRALNQHPNASFFDLIAQNIMTVSPKTIAPDTLIWEAELLLQQYQITALLVAQSQQLVGILDSYQIK